MGRTSDAREKILSAAQSLIELRGYSTLGVAEICKTAGIPKGSFYYFFESKEALALAVIDEHWAGQKRAWTRILNSDAEPLQRLCRLFEETEAGQRAGQQIRGAVSGCLFGNLTLEMSNHTEEIRTRLQEIFDAQVEMVESVITEALERKEVTATDTREAAAEARRAGIVERHADQNPSTSTSTSTDSAKASGASCGTLWRYVTEGPAWHWGRGRTPRPCGRHVRLAAAEGIR